MAEICQRNSCGGTVVNGICEDCGKAPVGKSLLSTLQASTPSSSTPVDAPNPATQSRRHGSQSATAPYTRRNSLGDGLIAVPTQADRDPLELVLENAEVPIHKRRCPACAAKVTRVIGYCSQCGEAHDFTPRLRAGDVVHGKLSILGPIAYGGLGWIYLGRDTLLERWVVLKGLLNGKDSAGAAAAVAERQFLAAVKHPKIVAIYDFIEHGGHGYIVMEYVSGRTIDALRAEQDRVNLVDAAGDLLKIDTQRSALTRGEARGSVKLSARGVLPVEEAIGYILAILPAFSYLHANQLVYCDFKPDNLMLEKGDVKLIDMGAVRRIGDQAGDIYGSLGFTAPEAKNDPVAVSDLFSIGRTLAVLVIDFDYQRTHEVDLPTPAEQPILQLHESFYRFLLKATHADPQVRFQTADAMADQLRGVLREIAAHHQGPLPAQSVIFWGDGLQDSEDVDGTRLALARLLPILKVDTGDPAANDLTQSAGASGTQCSEQLLDGLFAKHGDSSRELPLRRVDRQIFNGDPGHALNELKHLAVDMPFDWRVNWYLGKAYLAAGNFSGARAEFGKVYFELPGELAPKLAIAFAAERVGNTAEALQFYRRVASTDPNHASACFGWARCAARLDDLSQTHDALMRLPSTHSMAMQGRIMLAATLMGDSLSSNEQRIEQVADVLQALTVDAGLVHQLKAQLFASGLQLLSSGKALADVNKTWMGIPRSAHNLRLAAESEYRHAARFAKTRREQANWIERANRVRPLTFF